MTEIKAHTDDKIANRIFENSMLLYEVFEKPESFVKSRKYSVRKTNDEYICDISYVFNENIAESVDFSVTE